MAEGRVSVVPGDGRAPTSGSRPGAEPPPPAPAPDPAAGLPVPSLLVIAALAAAAFGQGGFYGGGQRVVACLVAAAAVVAVAGLVGRRARLGSTRPLVVAGAALAAWCIAGAALAGVPGAALPPVLLLAGAVVIVLTCAPLDRRQRDQLLAAVVALGVLVALTGWVGVAWHRTPWALVDQGLWRAATTLTYANAAGGLLAVVTLLALASAAASPRSVRAAATTCLLLTGLGASLSRGGFVAFAVGALVLVRLLGATAVMRSAVAPAAGALVALAGLWPSVPASSPSRPGVAAAGLAIGLLLAVAMTRLGARQVLALAACLLPALAVVAGGPGRDTTRRITQPGSASPPPTGSPRRRRPWTWRPTGP